MRSTVVLSFLSLVALAASGLVAGCDSDAKVTKSAEGETCERTADCNDGLKCIQGACYKSSSGGNEGGQGSGSGGSTVGPPAPVLGGLGESCTKRADCEDGLGCFNQRCVEDPTGEGGGGPIGGPELGGPGETCGLSSDCEEDLACVPQTEGPILLQAIGSNSVGVCTAVNTGLEPSGNECGHECAEAGDCCELPILYHQPYDAFTYTYGTGANSCAQLADLLTGVNCNGAALAPPVAARCFAQAAFCECAADTWACTNGSCVYEEGCTITALEASAQPGGCPSLSRSGRPLVATCNQDTNTCAPAAAEGCTNDASCVGDYVADSLLTDICVADECTCYQETSQCYRACSKDLDCRAGRVCDTATSVCVLAPACTEDIECIARFSDFRYKCITGACEIHCENDLDCNPGGLTNGGFKEVCGADNQCHPLGCTTNEECPPAAGDVRMFCGVAREIAVGGVESAITGGTPE
jgi:hypothetical protein